VAAAERNIANQLKLIPFSGGEIYPSNSVPVVKKGFSETSKNFSTYTGTFCPNM